MVVMGGAAAPANYQGPARIEPGEREVVAFIVRPVSGCTWPARPPVRNDRCRPISVIPSVQADFGDGEFLAHWP